MINALPIETLPSLVKKVLSVDIPQNARRVDGSGAPLLLGTDASAPGLFPGKSPHIELAELVATGFTPYEALATST